MYVRTLFVSQVCATAMQTTRTTTQETSGRKAARETAHAGMLTWDSLSAMTCKSRCRSVQGSAHLMYAVDRVTHGTRVRCFLYQLAVSVDFSQEL